MERRCTNKVTDADMIPPRLAASTQGASRGRGAGLVLVRVFRLNCVMPRVEGDWHNDEGTQIAAALLTAAPPHDPQSRLDLLL